MNKFLTTITGVLVLVVLWHGIALAASAIGSAFPILITAPLGGLSATDKETRNYLIDNGGNFTALTSNLHFLTDTNSNTTPSIQYNHQAAITLQADGDIEFGSGDLVFNNTRNLYPSLVDGTKAYHTTDRVAMSAPSGNTNQYIAAAQNPYSSINGTGALVLQSSAIVCEGTPNALNADLTVHTASTASGTQVIRNEIALFTGAVLPLASGSLVKVADDSYVTLVTASGSDVTRQSPDCDLVLYWIEV